ncbi:hypothetical protein NQ317_019449 [Molorchus minor]|uniref:Uncharacterized protein n=1 Tax=Molorchus minor TaxID=1323400 RepID=A0ABQ9JT82_9CUCU|nr:hypothetical protein NQ317_019449 [Molorchus minor]
MAFDPPAISKTNPKIFLYTKGSEDEIVSTNTLDEEEHSMERAMVLPQIETNAEHYPGTVLKQYTSNIQSFFNAEYTNIYSHTSDLVSDGPKISVKQADELFDKKSEGVEYGNDTKPFVNGKIDIFYLRAREIILASGTLPPELELRENGVFAKGNISKGTRYGPFQGKWASSPQDTRFAWEISYQKIQLRLCEWGYFTAEGVKSKNIVIATNSNTYTDWTMSSKFINISKQRC